MTSQTPVTLVGATGLTGSSTLSSLLSSTHPFAITTLTRRALPFSSASTAANPQSSYENRTYPDFSEVLTSKDSSIASRGGVIISCLGTTQAARGGGV